MDEFINLLLLKIYIVSELLAVLKESCSEMKQDETRERQAIRDT